MIESSDYFFTSGVPHNGLLNFFSKFLCDQNNLSHTKYLIAHVHAAREVLHLSSLERTTNHREST